MIEEGSAVVCTQDNAIYVCACAHVCVSVHRGSQGKRRSKALLFDVAERVSHEQVYGRGYGLTKVCLSCHFYAFPY